MARENGRVKVDEERMRVTPDLLTVLEQARRKRNVQRLLGATIGLSGLGWIAVWDWKIALGVLLLMWGNNILKN